MTDFDEQCVGIHGDVAGEAVDAREHVLLHGRARPEEFARRAVERVDDARLAGNPRDDFAPLAAADARVDPRHLVAVGSYGRLDEQPLVRVIEIPVIDDVLVVPNDLARVGVQRERRVVIEVLLVVAGERELRRG